MRSHSEDDALSPEARTLVSLLCLRPDIESVDVCLDGNRFTASARGVSNGLVAFRLERDDTPEGALAKLLASYQKHDERSGHRTSLRVV